MTDPNRRNRLAGETSPYLLQHADNPVDWHPWDDEALRLAREQDRPIFLSIGYAACHWCHVMERESFSDPAVADLLNASFVAIKVDREERPDVDAVYMAAVQAMTGSGGWPLNVFLSPDLEPLFGGTYFPPDRRWGRPSFTEILTAVAEAWRDRRDELKEGAGALLARLREGRYSTGPGAVDLDRSTHAAVQHLAREHDQRWGGFGTAPKFPSPSRLFFLLGRSAAGDELAVHMLTATLDGMAAGGMADWVGGGFHRYAVDETWLVPHFEKMLYDNALLARAYGQAGAVLDNPAWTAVARAAAEYLVREMQGPEGGFFASTDADSEGAEGLYFTWTPAEIRAAAPDLAAEAVIRACAVDEAGNFEDGRTILRPVLSPADLAIALDVSPAEAARRLEDARSALLRARSRRVPPALDDKRLAAWNGMAVWALAFLGPVLDEPRYTEAAQRAAAFLASTLVRDDGSVARSWRNGKVSGAETLEDLAWVLDAMVTVFEADGDIAWLLVAQRVADARLPFYQEDDGTVHDTPSDGEKLPLRPHDPYDGATPSAVAVLVRALTRLALLTGRDDLAERARRAVEAEGSLLERAPFGSVSLIDAARPTEEPPRELVLVGRPGTPGMAAMSRVARSGRLAPTVIAPAPAVPVPAEVVDAVPLFRGRETAPVDAVLAFLCSAGACSVPVDGPDSLATLLSGVTPS